MVYTNRRRENAPTRIEDIEKQIYLFIYLFIYLLLLLKHVASKIVVNEIIFFVDKFVDCHQIRFQIFVLSLDT